MKTIVLQPGHAPGMAALWRVGVSENAVAEKSFTPAMSEEDFAAMVAGQLVSGALFGWAITSPTGDLLAYLTAEVKVSAPESGSAPYLYLMDLDVSRAERRKGLATALVAQARGHAANQGLACLEVSWVSKDPQASAFWHSQGFTQYLSRARANV